MFFLQNWVYLVTKGGHVLYKSRYISYKIGYILGQSYKIRYACYKSGYKFYGYYSKLDQGINGTCCGSSPFISRPLSLVYMVLVFLELCYFLLFHHGRSCVSWPLLFPSSCDLIERTPVITFIL